ncbi:SLBB domain-containing protein, partial [Bacteroidota bacterium]
SEGIEQFEGPEAKESIIEEAMQDTISETAEEKQKELVYFGYSLFTGAIDKFTTYDMGPVDPGYQIGPGDEIIITMWGRQELRYTLTVSREGTIFIDNYGQMSVNGLTIQLLKEKLTNNLSRVYSGLKPLTGNPTTFLDVSLGKLKSFIVFLVGNVSSPGAVPVNSYSTAFNALYKAGGVATDGSLRNVQVLREGRIVSEIDLYDFILTGKKVKDIRLQNNDVIYVPPRISTITLGGEVKKQGIYELKKEENLKDLIRFSGGLKTTVDISRVQVERIASFEEREIEREMTRRVFDFALASEIKEEIEISHVKLYDEDIVTLYPIVDPLLGYVTINGAVYREGKYALEKNMTLAEIIEKSDGLKEEAYLEKADLTRTYRDGTTRHIEIDLNSRAIDTLILQDWDDIHIYSKWDFYKGKYVSIEGHIPVPDRYVLHKDMTVIDLIHKAGGLYDTVFWNQTYKIRADLIRYNEDEITQDVIPLHLDSLVNGLKSDILLKNRDRLIIYRYDVNFSRESVSVYGEVNNPGQYSYLENLNIHDLILRAGGFTRQAYKYDIEIYRIEYEKQAYEELALFKKVSFEGNMLDNFQTRDDFKIEERDIIVVRKDPEYEINNVVILTGEVKYPGQYPLLSKDETFLELIDRSGGLTQEAFEQGINFYRGDQQVVGDYQKLLNKRTKVQVFLKNGDQIVIPKHPGTVEVRGEVNNPGLVQYVSGWNLKDYVEAAGNFTIDAMEKETVVYYPGGNAKRRMFYSYPKVKEGSIILIPREPEKEPVNMTELMSNWASIISSFATVVFIISRTN